MKFAYLKTLVIIKLVIHCGLASAEQLSAHEYAEKTHNNIIEIIDGVEKNYCQQKLN